MLNPILPGLSANLFYLGGGLQAPPTENQERIAEKVYNFPQM